MLVVVVKDLVLCSGTLSTGGAWGGVMHPPGHDDSASGMRVPHEEPSFAAWPVPRTDLPHGKD